MGKLLSLGFDNSPIKEDWQSKTTLQTKCWPFVGCYDQGLEKGSLMQDAFPNDFGCLGAVEIFFALFPEFQHH